MDWGKPRIIKRDSVGSKPNLDESGTRYMHYMELKENFMLGLEVISGMKIKTEGDLALRTKLENAVEMIDRRILFLCDFNQEMTSGGNIAREVKAAGKHVTPLLTSGDQNDTQKNSNRKSTQEDSGGETANA